MSAEKRKQYKLAWQRNQRRRFAAENGFSTAANYANGGNRKQVLERDGYKCVKCGMTDAEHKEIWGRPITVDHKDKNRKNNSMENLQTLCLVCHGNKDLIQRLREAKIPEHKDEIIRRRTAGESYQAIADAIGHSLTQVWYWYQQWSNEQ